MIKRFKDWLIKKFLPAWAKEEMEKKLKRLEEENRKLKEICIKNQGYIEGLELGIRSQKRIIIKGDVQK